MPVAPVSAATPAAQSKPDVAKLRSAAQAFEAVFLRQMIHSMRAASPGDGLFDSSASEQFRDQSDAKLADSMASKGALHIADMLVRKYGARLSPAATATATAATPGASATPAATAPAAIAGDTE